MDHKERSFLRRGRQVSLRELTDLIAVRSSGREGKSSEETRADLIREVPDPQVHAFEAAGWVFVPRSQALPQEIPRAKVFVRPGGRLALSTGILTVKFREDLTEEEADRHLAPFGCRVIERLRFAPGFFRAQVTEPKGDVIDVANRLIESEVCEAVEPELIEIIASR